MTSQSALVRRFSIFQSPTLAVVLAYAICVLIWGTTWLAIKIQLSGMPVTFGAGVRFIAAAAILYACGAIFRPKTPRIAPPLHLVVVLAATMFGFNYVLTYLAETQLASGLVAVLFGTMPFFIFGFARVMLGERTGMREIVGALLALTGVAAISLVGETHGALVFVVDAVIAAALSGFANVYLKKYATFEPLATLPPAMLLAGLAMAGAGLATERIDWHLATMPAPLAAVAYLAACGSALAFYLNHWLLQRITPGLMGLSALMIPVMAVIVGILFGGEAFGWREILGAILVVVGVWISTSGPGPQVAVTTEPHPDV